MKIVHFQYIFIFKHQVHVFYKLPYKLQIRLLNFEIWRFLQGQKFEGFFLTEKGDFPVFKLLCILMVKMSVLLPIKQKENASNKYVSKSTLIKFVVIDMLFSVTFYLIKMMSSNITLYHQFVAYRDSSVEMSSFEKTALFWTKSPWILLVNLLNNS